MSHWEYPLMRKAGSLLAEVAAILHEHVVPGATPLQLDRTAEEEIRRRNCVPAFKGYRVGDVVFPNTICVSVNDRVIHGIPDDRRFEVDDVVSVDVGLSYGGYFADMAFTVVLGTDRRSWDLMHAASDAFRAGFLAARPGNRIGDVGAAIQKVVEGRGFRVVTDYVGHGIGRALHERPAVPNFGKAGTGLLIKPGMALAIEPMVTMGSPKVRLLDDGWTAATEDGSLAAHYEHTVLVTEVGPELLTA